jgi:hypothetical protein
MGREANPFASDFKIRHPEQAELVPALSKDL